jgi:hypothetical protein
VKPARIELHIEELVLHGFAPGDRHAIGDAVQHELTRLLAEQGIAPSAVGSRDRAHVDAGDFQVSPDAKAPAVGAQVARAVHGGLTR